MCMWCSVFCTFLQTFSKYLCPVSAGWQRFIDRATEEMQMKYNTNKQTLHMFKCILCLLNLINPEYSCSRITSFLSWRCRYTTINACQWPGQFLIRPPFKGITSEKKLCTSPCERNSMWPDYTHIRLRCSTSIYSGGRKTHISGCAPLKTALLPLLSKRRQMTGKNTKQPVNALICCPFFIS